MSKPQKAKNLLFYKKRVRLLSQELLTEGAKKVWLHQHIEPHESVFETV